MDALQRETNAAAVLLETLAVEIGDDDELAADMVEGSTNLMEAIDRALDRLSELNAHVDGLKSREAALATRRRRFEKQIAYIRDAIAEALDVIGKGKIERPAGTLYTSLPRPKLVITDETAISADYFVQPPMPPAVLDKKALLAALVQETPGILGARLSNQKPTLNIRTK